MDLLADILKQASLRRRILNQRGLGAKTALKFPCSKSIGFHVVTGGEGYIHFSGKSKPLHLKKGDIALMARGLDHILSTEASLADAARPMELAAYRESGKSSKLTAISGAYQFWNDPVHPFFSELPDWYVLQGENIESYNPLQSAMNMLMYEVSKQEIGSETVIQSLLDIIFSQILRRIVLQENVKPQTWSCALQNGQIRQALELMHANYSRDWKVEDLAKSVGLSRAGFAQKFKSTMGESPLHYLTTVRIQKAMELLSNSTDKIEVVADAVGYKDPFSFSKVFKKIAGMPPKEFRLRDRKDKSAKWRL